MQTWSRPCDYAGYNPEGHFIVLAKHRDSLLLDRVNWDVACERLAAAAGLPAVPSLGSEDEAVPPIYTWQASHWAVGWVEYLMAPADAPAAILEAAQAIADDLKAYPVLDDDRWSQEEHEASEAYWASESVRGRLGYIEEANRWGDKVSIFAARHGYVPDNDGRLDELLREGL